MEELDDALREEEAASPRPRDQEEVEALDAARLEAREEEAAAAEEARAETQAVAGEGGEARSSGRGGGGGASLPDRPEPEPPAVADLPPEQAAARLASGTVGQVAGALSGVATAAGNAVAENRAALAADPPSIPRPTGAPRTSSGGPPAPPSTSGEKTSSRTVEEGREEVTPEPEPTPQPAGQPPAERVPTPPVQETPEGEVDEASARRVQTAIRSLPTSDPALRVDSGPAPPLQLTGNADPGHVSEQARAVQQDVDHAAAQGQRDVAAPMGEDDLFPDVPEETLTANLSGGGGSAGSGAGSGAAVGGGSTGRAGGGGDEAVAIIAEEQQGDQVRAAARSAAGEIRQARQQQQASAQRQRSAADQRLQELEADNAAEQAAERSQARADVDGQRRAWSTEQRRLADGARAEAGGVVGDANRTITQESRRAQATADDALERGRREAAREGERGEREAEQHREEGRHEASGGFFGWLGSAVSSLFDRVKRGIAAAFERARRAVRAAIDAAKTAAAAAIEAGRCAVVGAIRLAGRALVAIGDRVLAGFPALRDRFRKAIEDRVRAAEEAVNRLADRLKQAANALLDGLGAALEGLLDVMESGIMAAVSGLESFVQGAIRAAKAALDALGTWAVLVRDIAAAPAQWVSNLGAAVMDGLRNHLWGALKSAIQTWFNQKVEQVLGLGRAVWNLLQRAGMTMAEIGRMAFDALKSAIPPALIAILVEKLASLIMPAAGAVMLIIQGLQAAWGAISSIMQAISRFIAFLRAVRGGGAGPQFAAAVAAGAVAVIDFISEFLLTRIGRGAHRVAGRIRAIAQRIGRRIGGAVRRVGRAVRRGARRLGGAIRRTSRRLRRRDGLGSRRGRLRHRDERGGNPGAAAAAVAAAIRRHAGRAGAAARIRAAAARAGRRHLRGRGSIDVSGLPVQRTAVHVVEQRVAAPARPREFAEFSQEVSARIPRIIGRYQRRRRVTARRRELALLRRRFRYLMRQSAGRPLTPPEVARAMAILRRARLLARRDFANYRRFIWKELRKDPVVRERARTAQVDLPRHASPRVRVRDARGRFSSRTQHVDLEHMTRLHDDPWQYGGRRNLTATTADINRNYQEAIRNYFGVWALGEIEAFIRNRQLFSARTRSPLDDRFQPVGQGSGPTGSVTHEEIDWSQLNDA